MLLEALMKKTAGAKDNGYDIIRQEIAKELSLDIDEVIISQGQIEILNDHIRMHFQSAGYLSMALWE